MVIAIGFACLTLGCEVKLNEQVGGRGPYIKDLEALVILGHTIVTVRYDVLIEFSETGTPIRQEPTAMLTRSLNVRVGGTVSRSTFSEFYDVRVFGNDVGHSLQITA